MAATACETLLQKVQTWWVRSSAADRTAWARAPRTRAESLAVAAAPTSFHASTLHACIEEENFRRGIAPTSRALLHLLRKHATSQSCASTHVPRRKSQFQWLRRWHTRWHVKLARIAAGEHIPDDVARSKAPAWPNFSLCVACAPLSLCLKTARRVNPRKESEAHQAALLLDPRCVPCTRRAQPGAEIWTPFLSRSHAFVFISRPVRSGLGATSSTAAAPPASARSK